MIPPKVCTELAGAETLELLFEDELELEAVTTVGRSFVFESAGYVELGVGAVPEGDPELEGSLAFGLGAECEPGVVFEAVAILYPGAELEAGAPLEDETTLEGDTPVADGLAIEAGAELDDVQELDADAEDDIVVGYGTTV